ncbi:Disulfide-bond oxidoreductase [Teratosphaeria destructans]|uniref:Disulfide-bond oxidoreductase n=1 Tax=Teratosphaeria destructans TaxID=418781 RepID=A0A9W7W6H5_9PEZI|nr:Disulfide-bond oxidoreductase [Teratosphaeria destructans]
MPFELYTSETPADVKNAKGLHLLTMSTPNGQAVQIFLEELKDKYGIEWTTTLINIMTNEQKKDWFLRIDPNGRIPVLVDNQETGYDGRNPFTVHETSAELFYLLKKYDREDAFGFKDDLERNQALQWTFFWHGSGAPYQGQVNHFTRAAPEKIEYAIDRFKNETLRVFGVLEIHLSGKYADEPREYLAGKGKGKYSVADMKSWPWVKNWERSGFTQEQMEEFPHVLKWVDRVGKRPAVQRGVGEAYQQK